MVMQSPFSDLEARGGHSPYDLLRTRVQKKRRKGSVFRYTASKGVVDVSPEKGVFFSSLSPFRGPISQSRFRGVLTPFDI